MADNISKVSKHWDNNSGSENETGVRARSETWLVHTTEPLDDEEVIRLAIDPYTGEQIPKRFDVWSGYISGVVDNDLRVVSVTPRRTEDILVWKVAVEYSTEARQDPDFDQELFGIASSVFDPRKFVSEWNGHTEKKAVQDDINGLALVNSSGQPFDPPPEEEETVAIRRFIRNERNFDDAKITDYMGFVNSNTVRIGGKNRDPYTVLMKEIRARREFSGALEYHVATYEMYIKPLVLEAGFIVDGGWYTRILDQGFQKARRVSAADPFSAKELGPNGEPLNTQIEDPINGWRLAQPALLDGDGQELRFCRAALQAPLDAMQTVFTVLNVTGGGPFFNTPDATAIVRTEPPFYIRIDREIMLVVDAIINVGMLKVFRGARNSVKTTHLIGAKVERLPTFFAFSLKKIVDFNLLNLE